jgi:hypothetical protein
MNRNDLKVGRIAIIKHYGKTIQIRIKKIDWKNERIYENDYFSYTFDKILEVIVPEDKEPKSNENQDVPKTIVYREVLEELVVLDQDIDKIFEEEKFENLAIIERRRKKVTVWRQNEISRSA